MRPRPQVADFKQKPLGFRNSGHEISGRQPKLRRGFFQRMRLKQNVTPAKFLMRIVRHIAVRIHSIAVLEPRRAFPPQQCLNFRPRPNIESTFTFLPRMRRVGRAVRIFRRIEPASGRRHIPHHVIENLLRSQCQCAVLRNLIRLQI